MTYFNAAEFFLYNKNIQALHNNTKRKVTLRDRLIFNSPHKIKMIKTVILNILSTQAVII